MTDLSTGCRGVVPLRARLAPWMRACLAEHTPQVLLARYGSPLNVQTTAPFVAHMRALVDTGAARGLALTPFFARKANKCLSYVKAARDNGFGIDAASLAEVQQALDLGVPGTRIVCTAGVKPDALIALCVARDVTVIVDNDEELAQLSARAAARGTVCRIGLRVAGFEHAGDTLHSRFGYHVDALAGVMQRVLTDHADTLDLAGLQFHLGGYEPGQRASAIAGLLPALGVLAARRRETNRPTFMDIGGGIPMRYLAEPADWPAYLQAHGEALDGRRAPITYNNDALGRRATPTGGWSAPDAYPTAHDLVQADWMAAVLDTIHAGRPLHAHLAELAEKGDARVIALVDIDNFKSVNDRYGHGVGDRVIKLVASTLEDACAPQFVGRWGGEEFIVVMPSSDLAAVVKRLNQARATLADTEFKLRETDEPMGLISFSGGVALAVGAGDANAAALRQADKALYRAKAAGRNCILSA